MIKIVNMTPASMSGETFQNSEPNLAINPANPTDIVATAFTPGPMGGANAPLYVSTDGGDTWSLRMIVPGNGFAGTADITVGFATTSGVLYAGTLNGSTGRLNILRSVSFISPATMTTLVDRASEDQPWVVAGSVVTGAGSKDRVYVGNNDFSQPAGATATVDISTDAASAPPPAGFSPHSVEHRPTAEQDGPPVRIALHPVVGVVYAAFERWTAKAPNVNFDVVVTRDDNWGTGAAPFMALKDSADGIVGQRVATGRFARWNDIMGQERLGADLAIAVDPVDPHTVWVAWCDRVGGVNGTDWTLHVRRSSDSGQTWTNDLRTITNVKNPSLAVNASRFLGLAYQAYTGARWETHLEVTGDGWVSAATDIVLHSAPATTPARTFLPYIGDYIRLLAVGNDFYGVFSGNNTPDPANFPHGVTYRRSANWCTHILLNTDGHTPVEPSIDPFFFHWSAVPWQAAFQANTGNLWVVGTQDDRGDMGLGMMRGTSPCIAAMPSGAWQAAFQANTGNLWVVGTQDDRGDMGLGMMRGTSPSITALASGGWQAAFQANTGNLWVVGQDYRGDMGLGMMAGTSPCVIALPEGGWQVVFQANTGHLWVIGQDYRGDMGLGMMAGTSPSIAR